MLLTITTTYQPADDLGYLLHKNPDSCSSFNLSFGQAHVFYPEASDARCTAALLLDVDPVGIVRNRKGPPGEGRSLFQYVNDRPYVASSFMSVALAQVFGSALKGRSRERPELAETPIPLRAKLSALPCRGGEAFLRRLFEPLGYHVTAAGHPLDETFPDWGESRYYTVELEAHTRLKDLLTHLYVLIPVLDDEKHYWVGKDEIEKLLSFGGEWLAVHPERDRITQRYLRYQRRLTREALDRLLEDAPELEREEEARDTEEEAVERRISLNEQRMGTVMAALRGSGAKRVLDLGCGEGQLLRRLLDDRAFTEIVGMDVSYRALERAKEKLKLDRLPEMQRERIRLMQGSLIYRDDRLSSFDAAAVVEVIEHLDPPRLASFERVLFEFARPGTIVVTTPNVEYNANFESLPAGRLRHRDHRFEWTRAEFRAWADGIAERFGYGVTYLPVGPEDPQHGSPTQMGIFSLSPGSAA
ncbi:MAG: 3' terminal RNA ribose 2'-O-methyltransferase Hen1 [Armatimonadetes bacterium]|nr:3' terminal RNA ribose 2'-O-methyltransferase Hen1 [Armatimonadota bacterium]